MFCQIQYQPWKNISKVKWLTSNHVGHWPNCSTWSPPRYWGRFNGVVSFYKQHYFLLQYWCCISFLPPSLLAIWHSVQLDFCLIWQKRTCEEIKCRVNFHWSHFQKHQISQKLWDRRDNAECTWRKRPLLLRIMLIVLLKHQYWDYAYTIS